MCITNTALPSSGSWNECMNSQKYTMTLHSIGHLLIVSVGAQSSETHLPIKGFVVASDVAFPTIEKFCGELSSPPRPSTPLCFHQSSSLCFYLQQDVPFLCCGEVRIDFHLQEDKDYITNAIVHRLVASRGPAYIPSSIKDDFKLI